MFQSKTVVSAIVLALALTGITAGAPAQAADGAGATAAAEEEEEGAQDLQGRSEEHQEEAL